MQRLRNHPLLVRVSDLKRCNMVRIIVAATLLASVSLLLLISANQSVDSFEQPAPGSSVAPEQQDDYQSNEQGRASAASERVARSDRLRCGQPVSTINARIVDGKIGSISDFPWIVSLQREKSYWFGYKYAKHACGGVLITASWILTATHCFYNREAPARVVAGTDNLNYMYRAQTRTVQRLVLHPKFDPSTFNNDLALIKVDRPFNIGSTFSQVRPICFEPGIPVLAYDIATIAGFGSKSFRGHTETRLYYADIAIIDRGLCNRSFDYKITNNMICAGGMFPKKRDACSGDSGGPLQMEVEDHFSLVGVVSFGNDCATKGYPGIYTKLNNYYAWVLSYLDEPLLDP